MSPAALYALLPILILVLGATVLLMLGAWWRQNRLLIGGGILVALAAAGAAITLTTSVTEVGAMFATTAYARFFTVVWALLAAATLLLSLRYGDKKHFPGGEYTSLVLFAGGGMALLSSATSLIGLFLGLESFTLALYILIAFRKDCAQGAEAGLKYLVMGAVATGFIAFGIALIYASSGSFHLPEAFAALQSASELRSIALLGWALLLVAIGFKVSLVPFHLWTPDVYQGAPAPISGLLAAGSKGAVLASLVPLFAGLAGGAETLRPLLALLAVVTMLVGSLCALRQVNLKRMLAYSSVVHMGTVLIGLIVGSSDGRSAVIFYVIAYAVSTVAAFAVITSLSASEERERQDYDDWRGLGYKHPWRGGVLAVALFSLAGVPPSAGFLAKFGIFHAALAAGYPSLALFGVLAALLSIYYYLKVVILLFMSEQEASEGPATRLSEHLVLLVSAGAVLVLGLYPGPLYNLITSLL